MLRNNFLSSPTVRYRLAKSYTGKELKAAAVKALIRQGFGQSDFNRIQALALMKSNLFYLINAATFARENVLEASYDNFTAQNRLEKVELVLA
jgi:hypothetical protein